MPARRLWLWHAARGAKGTCCHTLGELVANHLEPAGFTCEIGPGEVITLLHGPGVGNGSLALAARAINGVERPSGTTDEVGYS